MASLVLGLLVHMTSTKEGIISQDDGTITFTVNDVQTNEELLPLPLVKGTEWIIKDRCGGIKPEASSPFKWEAVIEPFYVTNALISALHLCWSNHYPLVLTPDMIWLSIAQGMSMLMLRNLVTSLWSMRERKNS